MVQESPHQVDKSIYLTARFFENLLALWFNPGGPVVQYESATRGISMLACRSLMTVKAEYQRGYEEATEQTRMTRKFKDVHISRGS